jgi:hypothetical protein
MKCHRVNCPIQAETEVTLVIGKQEQEKKVFYLCMFHYDELLQVARGMQIATGYPEITLEEVSYEPL